MIFNGGYRSKLSNFCITNDFLDRRLSVHEIDILKLIRKSNTKGEFRKNIKKSLYHSSQTNFYDFSLMMGLQFGVFNFYCYQTIDKSIKKKFVLCNPNPKESLLLFQNYGDSMVSYLTNKYGIEEKEIYFIVKKMFHLNEDNPYYHDIVVEDIGEMVISYFLYFSGKSMKNNPYVINHFFESGRAFSYFQECNHSVKQLKY